MAPSPSGGVGLTLPSMDLSSDAVWYVEWQAASFSSAHALAGRGLFPGLTSPPDRSRPTSAGAARAEGPTSDDDGGGHGSEDDEVRPPAPLVPESPQGQFLVQMLQTHPHLFPADVDQQLETLAAARQAEEAEEQQQASTSGSDLVLYRRIANLRAAERKRAVEDIMYALVVRKFAEAGVDMVPRIALAAEAPHKQVDSGRSADFELESVHSPEALEMVKEHLAMVLGEKPGANAALYEQTIAHISKLRVGQVYAASIMYGYFLRRVDQRFQLEKSMRAMAINPSSEETEAAAAAAASPTEERKRVEQGQLPEHAGLDKEDAVDEDGAALAAELTAAAAAMAARGSRRVVGTDGGTEGMSPGSGPGLRPSKLRLYVMSFDPETLQRAATMRSREGVNVIERHAEALFGRPQLMMGPDGQVTVASDDTVRTSMAGLRRMVLEAVAFGSFLWDVESHVDSQYKVASQ
eukprot:SM000249S08252  [mRNA]  locus=s249:151687:154175:- [translate_table: standard]